VWKKDIDIGKGSIDSVALADQTGVRRMLKRCDFLKGSFAKGRRLRSLYP
jgi:hypothetical protein